jgi:hypothetical protein
MGRLFSLSDREEVRCSNPRAPTSDLQRNRVLVPPLDPASATRMPEPLVGRECAVPVDAFHIGSGRCVTGPGRGSGRRATLAPVDALHPPALKAGADPTSNRRPAGSASRGGQASCSSSWESWSSVTGQCWRCSRPSCAHCGSLALDASVARARGLYSRSSALTDRKTFLRFK